MTTTLTEAFLEAVEQEEILLFSNESTKLDAEFVPGQVVPPFTAYVWNASADEWFVRFGTALDEPTMAELVDLLTTPPSDWEPGV
jgi:hypothetical protein